MVAVKAGEVEARLSRPDPRIAVFLLYGPDSGLVSERAGALAAGAVDNPADPFQLVKLSGDAVAADPQRLADEANTIGLFGGRRVIWVKPTSRSIAAALQLLLVAPPAGSVVVVEAGDLNRSSPLRALCERSAAALALPCYADEGKTLAAVVDDMLREAGLTIDRDGREGLLGLVGADRLATRNEVTKLALYARGQQFVTLKDVEAVVGDVSVLAFDAALDAAFVGDLAELDRSFARLRGEGLDPGTLLGMALRHALALTRARLVTDGGATLEDAAGTIRGLTFRRRQAVTRQVRLWKVPALLAAIRACGEAVAATRKQPALAGSIAHRALLDIAVKARRAARVRS